MKHFSTSASRVGWVVALALVFGSVGIPTASAVVDTSFSCPGSMAAAGFTDTAGYPDTTSRAIDCLAIHGITHGTTPTTFDPGSAVPRWQMALFLVRQAAAHGVDVPAPVDRGFTDLGGLSSEATDAINQLGQLGITLGTSENTFSPHEDVTRWQMALFITRLLAASGVSLPTAEGHGFSDLEGLSTQSVAAIDQLATLGVAEGTGQTTFSPFTETLRWQMALFLTRALAVGGVLPPGLGAIDVSPSGHAFLDYSGSAVSRSYTATVSMSGPFTVELWPSALLRSNGEFEAAAPGSTTSCDITLVDGGFHSADRVTDIMPAGESFSFTVGCTGLSNEIVPVVYAGGELLGLEGASPNDPATPTNAHSFGGGLTVVRAATAAPFGPVEVDAVDKDANSFESGGVTYFWDENDTFLIGGVEVTMAEWEAALTTGDDLLAGSVYDTDGVSVFDLQDDSPEAPGLSMESVTSTSVTLTYSSAPASDHLNVYSCEGTGCSGTLVRTIVAGLDEDDAITGTQVVITDLTPATAYDFEVTQVEGADESPRSPAVHVDTPVALTITDVSVNDVNDGAGGWTYLFTTFDADIAADLSAVASDFRIHVAGDSATEFSSVGVSRPFGTTDQLSFTFEFQSDTDPDTEWVLTIAEGALDVGAAGDPNGALTTTFGH